MTSVAPDDGERLDRRKVARFRQALRRGDRFPPLHVFERRAGHYIIFNGHHRFQAHRLEGRKTILVEIVSRRTRVASLIPA